MKKAPSAMPMPILSRNRTPARWTVVVTSGRVLFVTLLLLVSMTASAQTLARPGWAGSGLTAEPWWVHAVVYQIDPHGFEDANADGVGDFRGITKRLDYLQALGVDAISLVRFQPQQGDPVQRFEAVDPALGTMDDFDELLREASRSGMRVVVELDPHELTDPAALASVARFWLGRGVVGISLTDSGASSTAIDPQLRIAQLRKLREVTKSFAGQRILIGEVGAASDAHLGRGEGADMMLDATLGQVSQFNAAALRSALVHTQSSPDSGVPLIATDGVGIARSAARLGDGTNDAAIAKVLATVFMATKANPRLYFGQEIGLSDKSAVNGLIPWGVPIDPAAKPPLHPVPRGLDVVGEDADPYSVLSWYRHLIELHHGNAAFRSGVNVILNHDDQNSLVWVIRKDPVTPLSPAIIVACNLSAKPVTLSLVDDMRNLHLRGSFLRTVLRSDNGMGGMNLNTVTLGPFGVYIGQLKF